MSGEKPVPEDEMDGGIGEDMSFEEELGNSIEISGEYFSTIDSTSLSKEDLVELNGDLSALMKKWIEKGVRSKY